MDETTAQVCSFPQPPMQYIRMYTDENIARNLAPAPPPPIQGHCQVFGVIMNTEDPIVQPLESHGIRRLYPQAQQTGQQQQQLGQFDRKAELKKLNHSILATYLDLLEILIRSPMNHVERERKLEDLNLLFINLHHLINEYRPHQARETLKLMLEVQAQERFNVVQRFDRHFDAVVNNLQQCLKEVPDELCHFVPMHERTRIPSAPKQAAQAPRESRQVDNQLQEADWLMCKLLDNETDLIKNELSTPMEH